MSIVMSVDEFVGALAWLCVVCGIQHMCCGSRGIDRVNVHVDCVRTYGCAHVRYMFGFHTRCKYVDCMV